ncbi:hypothetical protein [Actinoallomurus iriomotensis]|uniref:Uncharacterized protein n=1 Tax=Actinoallomurus iriomotensis TaxID=478107 RepID=A0A9W6VY09_9ACTN|nr:hypothetical protein [Actinoallomurus iriomotensis]GLY83829.1 hypothetical protein Airi02_017580 [Actinoallomurus iriomotensis]
MRDDLEDLLTEHYRRAAEDIEPDAGLIDRCRGAARTGWAFPARWGPLVAAAAVALAVLTGWLLWPDQRPASVPPPVSPVRSAPPASPSGGTPVTPRPTPTGVRPPQVRSPADRTPTPRPTPRSVNPSPPRSGMPPVPSASPR